VLKLVLGATLILAAGCSAERLVASAPQPQKSALLMCHDERCATNPLLFVDGKRTSWEGPNDLNPGEIATVEVVKGAKALSLYGEEGRNGVVFITTKKSQLKF
jgi:TonB-dependent SusC/RagA subfamily outer membrane receptor